MSRLQYKKQSSKTILSTLSRTKPLIPTHVQQKLLTQSHTLILSLTHSTHTIHSLHSLFSHHHPHYKLTEKLDQKNESQVASKENKRKEVCFSVSLIICAENFCHCFFFSLLLPLVFNVLHVPFYP